MVLSDRLSLEHTEDCPADRYDCTCGGYVPMAEVERLREERDRYRRALENIDGLEGKVCPEYETCDHVGCRSSYGAWSYANGALHCSDPIDAGALDEERG